MSIEAMKLWLEALESSNKLINGTGTNFGLDGAMDGYYRGCFDVDGNNKLLNEAITSLRQAIEQAQKQEVKGWKLVPLKPTPEMCTAGYLARDKWPNHLCDNRQELHLSFSEPRWIAMIDAAPTPPQRQPLTDEQIDQIESLMTDLAEAVFYRDVDKISSIRKQIIEAAHGIKGEA